MQHSTITVQQAAGFKAAYTRKINQLDQLVVNGELTKMQAAGKKTWAKRRLTEQLST